MASGHQLTSLKAQRIAAGLSITQLARRATVSDRTIVQLEDGGTCDPSAMQRLLDALATPGPVTEAAAAHEGPPAPRAPRKRRSGKHGEAAKR